MSQLRQVLIAVDDLLVVEDLRYILERLGYSLAGVAQSNNTVIPLVRLLKPDIVIIDVSLCGDHNGVNTAIRLQKQIRVPLVLLSPYLKDVREHQQSLLDPYRVIAKPFDSQLMKAALESLDRFTVAFV